MHFQASSDYTSDISHSAPSASEASICSVEPGSADDVGKIVRYSDLAQQDLLTRLFRYKYWDQVERPLP